ncbi:NUDIX domain-containing protein [Streptomyces hoynatensis]|uniref:NUDIX domain-containing protein n=1 Tax=Streptomyces hoynatensis TaxID=1141874 RepID=A0A3A9YX13_9ACTN|nr:NUDIX domain-containing protein [Streptomyces hoynatensis]RKN40475.1 NUDIX domain-containing protein [Streptomyces hoynatensis]
MASPLSSAFSSPEPATPAPAVPESASPEPAAADGPPPAALPPATASITLLVGAVVVHDRERDLVLLLRRGPRAKFGRGMWDLPVGKSDPGEPVTATAVRELREETGLVADPADLRLAHVLHSSRGVESPNGFLTVIFLTHRWSGTAHNAEPHKHSEVRWFPVGDLPANLVFSADRVIHRCLAGEAGVTLLGWD